MQLFHSSVFYFHVVIGTMALLLFWVPIFTRKGGLDHKKFGRYFALCMYGLAFSGLVMTSLAFIMPLTIKGQFLTSSTSEADFIARVRSSQYFLMFLSLLVYVSVRQGMAALQTKNNVQQLRTLFHIGPICLLTVGGGGLLTLGINIGSILFSIFGGFGIFISFSMLKYCLSRSLKPGQWLQEHFGGLIGAGIGAYTAFLAFGARELLSGIGQWQLAFWIGPGVIGSIAITWYSRKYPIRNVKRGA